MSIEIIILVAICQSLSLLVYSGPVFGEQSLGCGIAFRPPSVSKCAESTSQSIIGGSTSALGSWPWIVLVKVNYLKEVPRDAKNPDGPKVLENAIGTCGGTIIDENWVLTAAHCLQKPGKSDVRVSGGDTSRSMENGAHKKVIREVLHQANSATRRGSDIILLQVDSPFTFSKSSNINKACLPNPHQMINQRSECYTMGWGRTSLDTEKTSDTLKEICIEHMNKRDCLANDRLSARDFMNYGYRQIFCGSHHNGREAPSFGDSGAPFLCKERDIYTAYGVLVEALKDRSVSIYANLTEAATSWIDGIINDC